MRYCEIKRAFHFIEPDSDCKFQAVTWRCISLLHGGSSETHSYAHEDHSKNRFRVKCLNFVNPGAVKSNDIMQQSSTITEKRNLEKRTVTFKFISRTCGHTDLGVHGKI